MKTAWLQRRPARAPTLRSSTSVSGRWPSCRRALDGARADRGVSGGGAARRAGVIAAGCGERLRAGTRR